MWTTNGRKNFRKFSSSGRRELPWSTVTGVLEFWKNLPSLDDQKPASANSSLDVTLWQVLVQFTIKIYFQAHTKGALGTQSTVPFSYGKREVWSWAEGAVVARQRQRTRARAHSNGQERAGLGEPLKVPHSFCVLCWSSGPPHFAPVALCYWTIHFALFSWSQRLIVLYCTAVARIIFIIRLPGVHISAADSLQKTENHFRKYFI